MDMVDAAVEGDIEKVLSLLGRGEDIERGYPLMMSVMHGHNRLSRILVNMGADVEARDKFGLTPLMYAVDNDDIDTVKFLIASGATPEVRDYDGLTPLICAATNGLVDMARLLLDNGVDPDRQNDNGETALMHAVLEDHPDIILLLLDRKADPHIMDDHERTAYDLTDSVYLKNLINSYPRSMSRNKDRSRTYMDDSLRDVDISFSS